MKLREILVGLQGLKAKGDLDLEIKGIEKNSKEVKEGYLFVAIKGFSVDGHEFIESAIEKIQEKHYLFVLLIFIIIHQVNLN